MIPIIDDNLSTLISLLTLQEINSSAPPTQFISSHTQESAQRIQSFLNDRHQNISIYDLLYFIQHELPTILQNTCTTYAPNYPNPQQLNELQYTPILSDFPTLRGCELYKLLGREFLLQQFQADTSLLCDAKPQHLSVHFRMTPLCPDDIRHIIVVTLYKSLTSHFPHLNTMPVFRKKDPHNPLSGFGICINGQNLHFVFQTSPILPISCTQDALTLSLGPEFHIFDNQMGVLWAHDTLQQLLRPCIDSSGHIDQLIRALQNGSSLVPNAHIPLPSRPLMSIMHDASHDSFYTALLIASLFGSVPEVSQFIHEVLSQHEKTAQNTLWLESCRLMRDEKLTIDELYALMQCIAHFSHVTARNSTAHCDRTKCIITTNSQTLTITQDIDAACRTIAELPLEKMTSPAMYRWLSSFIGDKSNPEQFLLETLTHSEHPLLTKTHRALLLSPHTHLDTKTEAIHLFLQTDPDFAIRLMQLVEDKVSTETMRTWLQQLPQRSLFYSKLLASSNQWAVPCVESDLQASIESLATLPPTHATAVIAAVDTHIRQNAKETESRAREFILAIQTEQRRIRNTLSSESLQVLVRAFLSLPKNDPLLQWYIQLVDAKMLQPQHAPYLQVQLLLSIGTHVQYIKQLKSHLQPNELTEIQKILTSHPASNNVQTLFFPPTVKQSPKTENTSPFADLVKKKNWTTLAARLLQTAPSSEHNALVTKTIEELLPTQNSHTQVFALLAHYRISSVPLWKKAFTCYEDRFDTSAVTCGTVTVMRCSDILPQECLTALYEDILIHPFRLSSPDSLCVLRASQTIHKALPEKLKNADFRMQMAKLVPVWLQHIQTDPNHITESLSHLYSWYLEFSNELQNEPTHAYKLVKLFPEQANLDMFKKCAAILLSIKTNMKSVVLSEAKQPRRSAKKPPATITMEPLIHFFKISRKWKDDSLIVLTLITVIKALSQLENAKVATTLIQQLCDFPNISVKEALFDIAKGNVFMNATPTELKQPVTNLVLDLLDQSNLKLKGIIFSQLFVDRNSSPSKVDLTNVKQVSSIALTNDTRNFYIKISRPYAMYLIHCLKDLDASNIETALEIDLSMTIIQSAEVHEIFRKYLPTHEVIIRKLFIAQLAYAGFTDETINFLKHIVHYTLLPHFVRQTNNSSNYPLEDLLQEHYETVISSPTNQKFYQYALLNDAVPVVSLASVTRKMTPGVLPSEKKFFEIVTHLITLSLEQIHQNSLVDEKKLSLLDFVAQCLRNLLETNPELHNLQALINSYVHCISQTDAIFALHQPIARAIVRTALYKNCVQADSEEVRGWWSHLSLTQENMRSQDLHGLKRISAAIDEFDHSAAMEHKMQQLDAILGSIYLWQEFYCLDAYSERLACLTKLLQLWKKEDRLVASEHIRALMEAVFIPNTCVFGADHGAAGHAHALECMSQYTVCLFEMFETHADAQRAMPRTITTQTPGLHEASTHEMGAIVALDPIFDLLKKVAWVGLYKNNFDQYSAVIKRIIAVMTTDRKLHMGCFINFIERLTTLLVLPIEDRTAKAKRGELILHWLQSCDALNDPLQPTVFQRACSSFVATNILDDIGRQSLPTLSAILHLIGKLPKEDLRSLINPIIAQLRRLHFVKPHAEEAVVFIKNLPQFLADFIRDLKK